MISKTKPENYSQNFEIVSCFVECDGKFLLLHRQDHKPQGNTWGVPAGKVHKDDTSLTSALAREVFEETGLSLDESKFKYFDKYYVKYPDIHFLYHVFSCSLDNVPEISHNPDEHKDYKWVTPKEALSMDLIQDEDFCIKNYYKIYE
jgi:8-oxo-dGTP pyrophosphatase MutT (NUDIX family)